MGRRAVISVSDKRGICELAKGLVELGFEIISTGGTYKTLAQASIPVTYISEITGFPEILDGRVKTLHPMIHGGILARESAEHQEQMKANGIEYIDLVAVNLYPFKETIAKPGVTLAEAIENIDIGGPSMVRSSAKNHERVTVIVNPDRYAEVLAELKQNGNTSIGLRQKLAAEAFAHTAEYDSLIASYLEKQFEKDVVFPQQMRLSAKKVQDLRYGENPQQKAALYANAEQGTLVSGKQLQGKELSYNNWMDMDAAWSLVKEFDRCACVIIKHSNPCGTALGQTSFEAYTRALEADPVSAFGGILAFNREVDAKSAEAMKEMFYEVIVAPEFSPEAREILSAKTRLRLFVVGQSSKEISPELKIKNIEGGYLVQDADIGTTPVSEWTVVTDAKPTPEDLQQLEFAWRVVKHVKSNAIILSKDGQTLGVGAGQMNRVGSVKIAAEQAGEKAKGAYLASDAFFPFPDSLAEAAKSGIRAVVQPGGSIKDAEVIAEANRLNLIMVFTQRRHFLH